MPALVYTVCIFALYENTYMDCKALSSTHNYNTHRENKVLACGDKTLFQTEPALGRLNGDVFTYCGK